MLFLVFCLLLPITVLPFSNMEPIRIEKCERNKWLVRHYIVYSCNYSDLADVDLARRELKPIACDPSNGLNTKLGKKPLFPGFEHKGDDGFIYECTHDEKTGSMVYKAKSCFIQQERFLAGHWVFGNYNIMYFCYKELDGVLRIRVRQTVHSACNPLVNDLRCQQGIAQTIMNSKFGSGEAFTYNPVNGESLTVAAAPPKAVEAINLQEDRPSVSAQDLLQAIRGSLVPSFRRQPKDEQINVGLADFVKKT